MNCKICNKEFKEDELNNGVCFDCLTQGKNKVIQNNNQNNVQHKRKRNGISIMFDVVIILVWVFGSITACISLLNNFLIGIEFMIFVCFTNLILKGFGEIIQLLEDIKNK